MLRLCKGTTKHKNATTMKIATITTTSAAMATTLQAQPNHTWNPTEEISISLVDRFADAPQDLLELAAAASLQAASAPCPRLLQHFAEERHIRGLLLCAEESLHKGLWQGMTANKLFIRFAAPPPTPTPQEVSKCLRELIKLLKHDGRLPSADTSETSMYVYLCNALVWTEQY